MQCCAWANPAAEPTKTKQHPCCVLFKPSYVEYPASWMGQQAATPELLASETVATTGRPPRLPPSFHVLQELCEKELPTSTATGKEFDTVSS